MAESIENAPEMDVNNEAVEVTDGQQSSEIDLEQENADNAGDSQVDEGSEQFPKKAINALNRKDKKITKLRAQMRELEAKLAQQPDAKEIKPVNADEFDNFGDYFHEKVKALVEQQTQQSQSELQRQQLTHQQEALKAQRDQYIIEQAQEASKTFQDLPQVWQQNAVTLSALPEQVADIFYNIDNAPAAIYMLAKEGKLEDLLYANPAIAAYEIVNAQNQGLELLSKTQTNHVSQAPTPISKAKGTGSVKKQLSTDDDVLRSLGIKGR